MTQKTPAWEQGLERALGLLIILSSIGLIVSTLLHISMLLDFDSRWSQAVFNQDLIHGLLLFTTLPLIMVLHKHRINAGYKNVDKAALQECPEWIKKIKDVLVTYGTINFWLFISVGLLHRELFTLVHQEGPVQRWMYSIIYMPLFAYSLAVFLSTKQTRSHDADRQNK